MIVPSTTLTPGTRRGGVDPPKRNDSSSPLLYVTRSLSRLYIRVLEVFSCCINENTKDFIFNLKFFLFLFPERSPTLAEVPLTSLPERWRWGGRMEVGGLPGERICIEGP